MSQNNDSFHTKDELTQTIAQLQQELAAIRRNDGQLRTLANAVENSSVTIVITDINGQIEYVNPYFTILTGYTAEEVIGQSPSILQSGLTPVEQYDELWNTIKSGQDWRGTFCNRKKTGEFYWEKAVVSPVFDQTKGKITHFVAVKEDITKRKRAEEIMSARVRLMQLAETCTMTELLQATLDEIELMTGSTIGFYHFLLPDQKTLSLQAWSTNTLNHMCTAEGEGRHYDVAEAGVWVDCVHQARPVMHNDYASLPHRKGMPAGHAAVSRELLVPVSRNGKIVAILGVGNKAIDYSADDLEFVAMLADIAWDIAERKRAEEELQILAENERKRRLELEKLSQVSLRLRQASQAHDFLEMLTDEMRDLCGADMVYGTLLKEDEPVVFANSVADGVVVNQEEETQISRLLSAEVAADQSPEIAGFQSTVLLPLRSSDALQGVILVCSRQPVSFTGDERNMLAAVADMAGTALQRIDFLETMEKRVERRTHELVVLYNLMTIVSESWRLHDILELSLVLTLETIKVPKGIIYLVDQKVGTVQPAVQRGFGPDASLEVNFPADDCVRSVIEKQEPLIIEDVSGKINRAFSDQVCCYAGIPIRARGKLRGVFSLFSDNKGKFTPDVMALLSSIADHIGIGIENAILMEQAQENAVLEERNRLARDLHDSVTQLLYSLTLMAGSTKKLLSNGSNLELVKNSVTRLGDTAHQALKEMRLLLYELRPTALDSDGLVGALRHRLKTVEERVGIKVDFQVGNLPVLPAFVEDGLYHIALEALNNIIKHSEGTSATIRLTDEDGILLMEVVDNGKGFDSQKPGNGQGMRNMRERARNLGGELEVTSSAGQGARVSVRMTIPSSS